MPTLILHAPDWRTTEDGAKSFNQTIIDGVCSGYAIPSTIVAGVILGIKVVLLNKAKWLRAEGVLVSSSPTEKTKSGIQRYDIKIRDVKLVTYQPERLGRTGVAVI